MSKKCLICQRQRPDNYYTYQLRATACIKCWRKIPFSARVQPKAILIDEIRETIDQLPSQPGPCKQKKIQVFTNIALPIPVLKREKTLPPAASVVYIVPEKNNDHLESKTIDNYDHLKVSAKKTKISVPDPELLRTLEAIGMTYQQYLITRAKMPTSMK